MNVSWIESPSAECFYAGQLKLEGRLSDHDPLSQAIDAPVAELQSALSEAGIPPQRFFEHLVPLAADSPSVLELARATLTKTIGREKAAALAITYHGLLSQLRQTFDTRPDKSSSHTATRVARLMQQWPSEGALCLNRIEQVCEPGLIAEGAKVVLAALSRSGAGAAYPRYNTVCLDVGDDREPRIPAIVRLAWLLSTLNLDLPRFSEQLRPGGGRSIGLLAMIPPTLLAWKEVEASVGTQRLIQDAIRAWFPKYELNAELAANLHDWWQVYEETRISWPKALKALDQLIGTLPLPTLWTA